MNEVLGLLDDLESERNTCKTSSADWTSRRRVHAPPARSAEVGFLEVFSCVFKVATEACNFHSRFRLFPDVRLSQRKLVGVCARSLSGDSSGCFAPSRCMCGCLAVVCFFDCLSALKEFLAPPVSQGACVRQLLASRLRRSALGVGVDGIGCASPSQQPRFSPRVLRLMARRNAGLPFSRGRRRVARLSAVSR